MALEICEDLLIPSFPEFLLGANNFSTIHISFNNLISYVSTIYTCYCHTHVGKHFLKAKVNRKILSDPL